MSVNWISFRYDVNLKNLGRIVSDDFQLGYLCSEYIENSISKMKKLGLVYRDKIDFKTLRSEDRKYICLIDFHQFGGYTGYNVFDLILKEKIWGEDFIDDLKNNKASLIVDSGCEGDETLGADLNNLSKLNELLESFEIPHDSVLLVGGTIPLEKHKKAFNYKLHYHDPRTMQCFYASLLDMYKKGAFMWLFENSQKYLRLKHYFSPNYQPRLHRLKLVEFLKRNNLLDRGLISFPSLHDEYLDDNGKVHTYANEVFTTKEEKDIAEYIKDVLPLNVDTAPTGIHYMNKEVGSYGWNPDPPDDKSAEGNSDGSNSSESKTFIDKGLYNQWDSTLDSTIINPSNFFNSYFEITTGTHCGNPKVIFSEKNWKPLLMFSPSICLESPFALLSLQQLGFKTFDGWIDESYDTETEFNTRIKMAFNEIKKLCDMELVDLHKKYFDIQDILIHNHKHFFDTFIPNMYHQYLDVVKEMINE